MYYLHNVFITVVIILLRATIFIQISIQANQSKHDAIIYYIQFTICKRMKKCFRHWNYSTIYKKLFLYYSPLVLFVELWHFNILIYISGSNWIVQSYEIHEVNWTASARKCVGPSWPTDGSRASACVWSCTFQQIHIFDTRIKDLNRSCE